MSTILHLDNLMLIANNSQYCKRFLQTGASIAALIPSMLVSLNKTLISLRELG